MEKDENILSLEELSIKLNLHRHTISEMVKEKRLPVLRASKNGRYRFYWPAVQEAMSKPEN